MLKLSISKIKRFIMRIINERVKCACCGNVSNQDFLLSYSTFGSPDLDYKRTGMASMAFVYGVQICPDCFYVANDISAKVPENLFAQRKEYYQEAIKNEMSLDIKKFFLLALIEEDNKRLDNAAVNYIYAFWLSEGENDNMAGKFLKRAIKLRKEIINDLTPVELLQTIDLLRRNQEFAMVIDEANKMLAKAEKLELNENQIKILNYQIKLANRKARAGLLEVIDDAAIRCVGVIPHDDSVPLIAEGRWGRTWADAH